MGPRETPCVQICTHYESLGWLGWLTLPEPRRAWETLLGAAHVYESVHMRGCWALGPKSEPMCTNLYT